METTHPSFDPRQEMRAPDYEVFHYCESAPLNVAVHHHDFYEIYFFLSGDVEYDIEGRGYQLEPGNLLLVSPLELHQLRVRSAREPYNRIVLWMNPGYLSGLSTAGVSLTRCFDHGRAGHTNCLRLDRAQDSRVHAILDQLVEESGGERYASGLCARGLLMQLLVEVNRLALEHAPAPDTPPADSEVSRVVEYINGHYHEKLSLDELAELFFISKFHLAHQFQRVVGTSVYRYIMLKRLQMAKQMLRAGVPPTDVFRNCGFSDYPNFYRAFKRQYGVSPKEFADWIRG